jgi:hypothetical protein
MAQSNIPHSKGQGLLAISFCQVFELVVDWNRIHFYEKHQHVHAEIGLTR